MAKRNRSKRSRSRKSETLTGVGWYRPDQWQRLLDVAADRDSLHDTYEEWLVEANKVLNRLRTMGVQVRKVDVDVEEMVRWCEAQRLPVNGESRASFVSEKTRQLSS